MGGRGELSRLRPLRVLEIDARVVGMAGGSFSSYVSVDEVEGSGRKDSGLTRQQP